jgi:hypothetical protein
MEGVHPVFVSTEYKYPNLNAVLLDVKSDNVEYPSIFNFHPYALGISTDKSQPLIVLAPLIDHLVYSAAPRRELSS